MPNTHRPTNSTQNVQFSIFLPSLPEVAVSHCEFSRPTSRKLSGVGIGGVYWILKTYLLTYNVDVVVSDATVWVWNSSVFDNSALHQRRLFLWRRQRLWRLLGREKRPVPWVVPPLLLAYFAARTKRTSTAGFCMGLVLPLTPETELLRVTITILSSVNLLSRSWR